MAEFQEVMRQLNRMCSSYPHCESSGCPISDECGNLGSYCSFSEQSMSIEKSVMSWAAEHPESTTVYEWLVLLGLLSADMWSISDLNKPIPADIAQKLGIEPKEAKCDETT